jgi:hypothetical protein
MMTATELFKGQEDIAKFLRMLDGLHRLRDIVGSAATLIQAADEAKAAHAKALADRDAIMAEQAQARDTLAAIEAEGAAAKAAAEAKAADILAAARADAEAIVERAKQDSSVLLNKTADEVAQGIARRDALIDERNALMVEVSGLEARRDALREDMAKLAAKLGV